MTEMEKHFLKWFDLLLIPMNWFNAAYVPMSIGPLLEHGQPIRGDITEENWLFFPHRSYQFSIAPQLQVGFHELLLHWYWDFVLPELVLSIQSQHCMSMLSYLTNTLSMPLQYQSFWRLSMMISMPFSRRFVGQMFYLDLNPSQSLILCRLTSCRSLY